MLFEGPELEPLVWDSLRAWMYGSCGLFLIPSPGLPIHRDTFSRYDIAQSAESIRRACVNEEHGYRGGIALIAAGVFQVALSGKPIKLSVGNWEKGISLNATALKNRASNVKMESFGSDDFSKRLNVRTGKWKS